MFSKISRYRRLPDDVTLDAAGRRLRSRRLRLLPRDSDGTAVSRGTTVSRSATVSGDFVHLLEQGDRLDHLAEEHYEQSRDWWRICDANPEYLSPWELVGSAPRTTVRIDLSRGVADGEAPWCVVLSALRGAPGVESAVLGTPEMPFPVRDDAGGEDAWHWVLTLVFNALTTSAGELLERDDVAATGFSAATPRPVGRVGKPVAIP